MLAWLADARSTARAAADRAALAGGSLVLVRAPGGGALLPATRSGSALRRCSRRPSWRALAPWIALPLSSGGAAARRRCSSARDVERALGRVVDRAGPLLGRVQQGLVYAASLVVGIAAGAPARARSRLAALLLAGLLGAAVVWALAGKAIPALFPDGGRAARLRDPIGYWNALALAADALLGSGSGSLRGRRSPGSRSSGACWSTPRSWPRSLRCREPGVLGALVAVALWLLLSGDRVEAALLGLAATVPAVVVAAGRSRGPASSRTAQAHADRVADGAWSRRARSWPAAPSPRSLPLCARGSRSLTPSVRRRAARGARARVQLAAVAIAPALAVVLVAEPRRARRQRAVDPAGSATLSSNNRWIWWGEAWQVFARRPGRAAGAGTLRARAHSRLREDAHRGRAAQRAAPAAHRHRAVGSVLVARASSRPPARRRRRRAAPARRATSVRRRGLAVVGSALCSSTRSSTTAGTSSPSRRRARRAGALPRLAGRSGRHAGSRSPLSPSRPSARGLGRSRRPGSRSARSTPPKPRARRAATSKPRPPRHGARDR